MPPDFNKLKPAPTVAKGILLESFPNQRGKQVRYQMKSWKRSNSKGKWFFTIYVSGRWGDPELDVKGICSEAASFRECYEIWQPCVNSACHCHNRVLEQESSHIHHARLLFRFCRWHGYNSLSVRIEYGWVQERRIKSSQKTNSIKIIELHPTATNALQCDSTSKEPGKNNMLGWLASSKAFMLAVETAAPL